MADGFQPDVRRYTWVEPATAFRTTRHSGLPLTWHGAEPSLPEDAGTRSAQLAAKRTVDVIVALLAIIALGPLLVLVAIAIKLSSPGKVLFRQQREGLNGALFWTLKFRSMRTDLGDETGVNQTRKDDPRVTPIGRFIRRTSIDELPQLFNVLCGDMSLVGPRPHVPGMYAGGLLYRDLVGYYPHRFTMKPGITGWAQANGLRGPTEDAALARSRVDHDVAYCQNFSLALDMKIIMQTLHREFIGGSGH